MLILPLLLAFSLFIAGLLWFAVPFALRFVETRRLRKLCARKRAIVLTYDDGPSQTVSPALTALLAERKVPATFFLLGTNVAAHPDLVRQLKQDGHEIGSHTGNHSNAWKTTPWRALRDVQAGRAALREIGVPTRLFRPPFGKTTLASLFQRLKLRLRFAYWTVDSRDSWDRRPVEDILSEIEALGGGVVLMHDFDAPTRGPNPTAHQEYVLRLTGALVDFAEKNGFNCMRFGDLIDGTTGDGGAKTHSPHVMAISSAGGHWVQLMRLRPAWDGLRVTYVTTDPGLEGPLREETRRAPPRFHVITAANRWQKARLLKQLVQLALIFLRTPPDVVITTGAAPGYFALRLGRFFGARTIWVDSMANAEEMSLSGQHARAYADLWLTQWEHMATPGGPSFLGSVL